MNVRRDLQTVSCFLGGAVAVLGCAYKAPRPTPAMKQAEEARRQRLPEDARVLDGTWEDARVRVIHHDGLTEAILEVRHPKLRYFYHPPEEDPDKDAAKKDSKANPADDQADSGASRDLASALPDLLRRLAPVNIDRVEIHDGELVFVDMSKPSKPELWLSNLEVSIEKAASRKGLAEGFPVLITVRGKVQRSGDLELFVSADPWSEDLNFSGRAVLQNLATKDLYGFLADTAKLQVSKGSLDIYLAFAAKNGRITGGVKPVLKNAEVRPVYGGVLSRARSWVANRVLGLFSDRVPGRRAVATVIPIDGEIKGPNAKLWPALTGVLYNAYVNGLSAGFGGLPPVAARKPAEGEVTKPSPGAWRQEARIALGGIR